MEWLANRSSQLVSKFKPKRYTTVVMMLIIWAGVVGSLFAGISSDLRSRAFLMGRAVTIADALPANEVLSLHGNTSDSNTPAYRDLKQRLERVRHDQDDLHFASLVGVRDSKVFFYVNSAAPGTSGYEPPGGEYTEASGRLQYALQSSEPFIDGPIHDRWGRWITAFAPITDPHTNQTIALVRIDVSATSYYSHIALYTIIPLMLAAIPLAGLLRDRKIEAKEYEIGELKKQFVSIASHELRSPLNGLLWAEQSLLRDGNNLTKAQQDMVMDMYRSTEVSITTVNEILDLSIFERGQADKLQHEQVDLQVVVKQVIATLRLAAQERKIHVSQVGNWPEQVMTIGDVAALKRAFMNLVANAIKYSHEKGSVEISYRQASNEHIIAIKDDGIGIPVEEQAKVLGGYYRATNANQVQSHGTGLGLWLARMLAEQHHGRLWLRSRLNHGTTIFVALPIAVPTAAAATVTHPTDH